MMQNIDDHVNHFTILSEEFNDPVLPYSVYEKMRQKGSLIYTDQPTAMASESEAAVYERAGARNWIAIGFETCDHIVHDWGHFSNDATAVYPSLQKSRALLQMDPPLQQEYRKLINPYFSPRRVEAIEPLALETANEIIDGFIESGEGDLGVLAWGLPGRVLFAEILGLPVEEVPECLRLLETVTHAEDLAMRDQGMAAYQDHLRNLLRSKALRDQNVDAIDMLLSTTAITGQRLPVDEVVMHATLLVAAGLETTSNALTNAYFYLAHNPEQRNQLIESPALVASAVEEFIRFDGSVHSQFRVVARDAEVDGHLLKRGDTVELNFGAANRDPSHFLDAEKCVLDRDPNAHLGFGAGPHRCLGSNLARMELRVGLTQVLSRIPDFRVTDSSKCDYVGNFATRGYRSLPVSFTTGTRIRG